MDRVRLGRALGYGTRQMAKTVAAVAEAATAPQTPSPAAPGSSRSQPASPSGSPAGSGPASEAAPPRPVLVGRVLPTRASARDLGGRAKHLKRSVWQPLAVFSGALWLRVTGVFFALLAGTMGTAAWRQRADLHAAAGSPGAHRFWLFACFTALFGYFAVSSFIRANLRERRASARR